MRIAFLHVEDERNNPGRARKLAEIMVASVRKVVAEPYLIQMTDSDTPKLEGVDEISRLEMDHPNFMVYRLTHLTRFRGDMMILDTDVMVLQDPSHVFKMAFDVALTKRDKHIISKRMGYTADDPWMPFNTGVMFSRSRDFWKDALEYCKTLEDRHQKWFGDQISVAEIVYRRKYDVAVLPCDDWNYSPASSDEPLDGRKIVHFKGESRKQWMIDLAHKSGLIESVEYKVGNIIDPYSTHLEALVKTAMETKGGILELGCGNYSTPVLEAIAKSQGRTYKAQASNATWAKQFNGSVQMISWESWTPPRCETSPDGKWGMVFLDSEEKTWDRVKRIPQLAEVTDTVVVHDADVSMMREGWPAAVTAFPDVTIFDRYKPNTAVMRKYPA